MDKFGEMWKNTLYRVNEKMKKIVKSVKNDKFSYKI